MAQIPHTLEQFTQQTVAAGILASDDLQAFIAALPADRRPQDAEHLARELVRERKLTAFQAQQILLGKARHLVLGNYHILDRLGQGGMGLVFKAEHRRMARQVALKVLPPKAMSSQGAIKRFQREVQAAAKLMHPNIVAAYDADESRGVHYFVMELVEGRDLATLVKAQGPLPVNRVLDCILQAARGLEYAHERGVIHRDIKPSNLLIGQDGTVKILDMGLARIESVSGAQADLTGTGQIMGTVDYMAPEQAANTRHADRRSDIYSLGCTLWFLVTGKPLYAGETMVEKLLAHREQPIPSLAATCPAATKQLDAVFQRLVAKLPDDRYPTLAAAITELERCKTGDGDSPTIDIGPGEDTQYSQFLKGLGTRPSGAAAAALAPLATAVKPDSSIKALLPPGMAETVKAADEQDTDRELPPLVHVSGPRPALKAAALSQLSPRPADAASPNWRHPAVIAGFVAGALGLVMLAALGVWLAFGRPGTGPQGQSAGGGSAVPGGVTAKQGEVVALRLDTSADYAELPGVQFDPAKPGTIEFWLEERRAPQGAIPLVLKGRGSVLFLQCLDNRRLQLIAAPKIAIPGQDSACKQVVADAVPPGRIHLAATWDGAGKYALFVHGKLAPAPHDLGWRLPLFPSSSLSVPPDALASLVSNQYVTLREVRWSNIVRYRTAFSPPERLTADQATLVYFPCTEGAGAQLTDASAAARHAKIVGGKWVVVSTTAASDINDPHRRAADWVQSVNGSLRLRIKGQELPIVASEPLPEVPFEVASVNLEQALTANKSGLVNLEPIKPLDQLVLRASLLADDDWTALSRLSPRDLFIYGTSIREPLSVRGGQTLGTCPVTYLGISLRTCEPGSLAAFKDLPNLKTLLLKQCTITPEVLAELTQVTRVEALNLETCDITDLHLSKLTMPGLKSISLFGSTVTVAGLVEFRTRHPGILFRGVDALVPMLPPETPTAPMR